MQIIKANRLLNAFKYSRVIDLVYIGVFRPFDFNSHFQEQISNPDLSCSRLPSLCGDIKITACHNPKFVL